jgi:hypothetical protein
LNLPHLFIKIIIFKIQLISESYVVIKELYTLIEKYFNIFYNGRYI